MLEELFKYLRLLNEAMSVGPFDNEIYARQQKVCDAIEKELGIQPVNFDACGRPVVNNYSTTNIIHSPKVTKEMIENAIDKFPKM